MASTSSVCGGGFGRNATIVALILRLRQKKRLGERELWECLSVCEQHWIERVADLIRVGEDEAERIGLPRAFLDEITALTSPKRSRKSYDEDELDGRVSVCIAEEGEGGDSGLEEQEEGREEDRQKISYLIDVDDSVHSRNKRNFDDVDVDDDDDDEKREHHQRPECDAESQAQEFWKSDDEVVLRPGAKLTGVMYFLGSDHNRCAYSNPADDGRISLSFSSRQLGSCHPVELFSRRNLSNYSSVLNEPRRRQQQQQHITFSLGQYRLLPSHYSIKSDNASSPMRNWVFEASVDGIVWVPLHRHCEDDALSEQPITKTWPIGKCASYFSKLRLRGLFVSLSGFEVYGSLRIDTATSLSLDSQLADADVRHTSLFGGLFRSLKNHARAVLLSSNALSDDSADLESLMNPDNDRPVIFVSESPTFELVLAAKEFLFESCIIAPSMRHCTVPSKLIIEASNDGSRWTRLCVHRAQGDLTTFRVPSLALFAGPNDVYYNRLRLRLAPLEERSNAARMSMGLLNIEFHGYIRPNASAQKAAALPLPRPLIPSSSSSCDRKTQTFKYEQDFDEHGVLFYIGTKYGTQPYQNPASIGLISANVSPISPKSDPSEALVGRDASSHCFTLSSSAAMVTIDLRSNFVCPTHYSLRHSSSSSTDCIRSWVVQGSSQGGPWSTLSVHRVDKALRYAGATSTWKIESENVFFNQFRISQTGANSSHRQNLALGGFEVYGRLSVHDERGSNPFPAAVKRSPFSPFLAGSQRVPFIAPIAEVRQQPSPLRELQPPPSPPASKEDSSSLIRWDPEHCTNGITVRSPTKVVKTSSNPKQWQTVRSAKSFSNGRVVVRVRIARSAEATNSWRFIIGAVCEDFDFSSKKVWVGAQKLSWGYIGNGQKCHHSKEGTVYGSVYRAGDIVSIVMDFETASLSFMVNGEPQGVAFSNFSGPAFAAVSIIACESSVELVDVQEVRQHSMVWDPVHRSATISFDDEHHVAIAGDSSDKWQTCRALRSYSSGKHYFEAEIVHEGATSNKWKLLVGVVPASFDFRQRQWLGAQASWGYAAVGRACHKQKSGIRYGAEYGEGDRIGVFLDFDNATVTFFKNGMNLGVAFKNLCGTVHPAVSMCGQGTRIVLRTRVGHVPSADAASDRVGA